MENIEDISDEIRYWLREIKDFETLDFIKDGAVKITDGDVLFGLGNDKMIDALDVSVLISPSKYKNLTAYLTQKEKLEEAVKIYGQSNDYVIRNILWKTFLKSKDAVQRDSAGKKITDFFNNSDYVKNQIRFMNEQVDKNPYLSVGIAKELIETCCKSVLERNNVEFDSKWNIIKLVKETKNTLSFPAAKSVSLILGGLSNIVHGIAELRNEYGSGHGHVTDFKGIDPVFSKLAVTSATAFVLFYLEFEETQNSKGQKT